MTEQSVVSYGNLQYITEKMLIYALICLPLGLSTHILTQCSLTKRKTSKKDARSPLHRLLRKKSNAETACSTGISAGISACSTQKDESTKKKEEEKPEKKEEEKLSEGPNDNKNFEEVKIENEVNKEVKMEEERNKEKKRRLDDLKPKQIKHTPKEERIAMGIEVRTKGDYPTFGDVESDWETVEDKKDKDKKGEQNEDGKKKATKPTLTAKPEMAKVAASGGKWTQQLHNSGGRKIVFKIKCSNNSTYRVTPVFGFVDACGQANIEVVRLKGPPKEDKLVVQYVIAPAGATNAQSVFAHLKPTDNMMIKMIAS